MNFNFIFRRTLRAFISIIFDCPYSIGSYPMFIMKIIFPDPSALPFKTLEKSKTFFRTSFSSLESRWIYGKCFSAHETFFNVAKRNPSCFSFFKMPMTLAFCGAKQSSMVFGLDNLIAFFAVHKSKYTMSGVYGQ
jgi:hypothetical protein